MQSSSTLSPSPSSPSPPAPAPKHAAILLSGSTLIYEVKALVEQLHKAGMTCHVEATPRAWNWLTWHNPNNTEFPSGRQRYEHVQWLQKTFPGRWSNAWTQDGTKDLEDLTGHPVILRQRPLPGADRTYKRHHPDVLIAFGASMNFAKDVLRQNSDGFQARESAIDRRGTPLVMIPFSDAKHVDTYADVFEALRQQPDVRVLAGPDFMPFPQGGTRRISDWPIPFETITSTAATLARGETLDTPPTAQQSRHQVQLSVSSQHREQALKFLSPEAQVLRKPTFDKRGYLKTTDPILRSILPGTWLAAYWIFDAVKHQAFPLHTGVGDKIALWIGAQLSRIPGLGLIAKAIDHTALRLLNPLLVAPLHKVLTSGPVRKLRDNASGTLLPKFKAGWFWMRTGLEFPAGRALRGAAIGAAYLAVAALVVIPLISWLIIPVAYTIGPLIAGLTIGLFSAQKLLVPPIAEHLRYRRERRAELRALRGEQRVEKEPGWFKRNFSPNYGPEDLLPGDPSDYRDLTPEETYEGVAKLLGGMSGKGHPEWNMHYARLHSVYRLGIRAHKGTGEQKAIRRSTETSAATNLAEAWNEVNRCVKERTGKELSPKPLADLSEAAHAFAVVSAEVKEQERAAEAATKTRTMQSPADLETGTARLQHLYTETAREPIVTPLQTRGPASTSAADARSNARESTGDLVAGF